MTDKTKAATPAGTGMTAAHDTGDQSEVQRNAIIPRPRPKRKDFCIVNFIPEGKINAIPRRDLATLLNMHERQVRQLIQHERESGAPILSDVDEQGGYWVTDLSTPEGQQEAARFLRQERSRAGAIHKRLSVLEQKLRAAQTSAGNQVQVEGWEQSNG